MVFILILQHLEVKHCGCDHRWAFHPHLNHHFVYQVCPIKWDKPAGSLVCEEEEEEEDEWVQGVQRV